MVALALLQCMVTCARAAEVMPCYIKVRNNSLRTDTLSCKISVINKSIGRKERVSGCEASISVVLFKR